MCVSRNLFSFKFQDDLTKNSNFLFFKKLKCWWVVWFWNFHAARVYIIVAYLSLLTYKVMVPGSMFVSDLVIVLKPYSYLHLLATFDLMCTHSILIGEGRQSHAVEPA